VLWCRASCDRSGQDRGGDLSHFTGAVQASRAACLELDAITGENSEARERLRIVAGL
jgi:hypothetical protein